MARLSGAAEGTLPSWKRAFGNVPLPPGQVTGLAVCVLLQRLHPVRLPGPRLLNGLVGTGLVLAGVGINTWALIERRRRSAGPFALERPDVLVTSGPYAYTRHPMYVGWWLVHLGAGGLAGTAWGFATMPAGSLAEHWGVLHEEATLSEQFQQAYADYSARVPRYVGFRRRDPGDRRRNGVM
ncbi:methyltransferase family protein [Paenarthrobacter sp. FR1]|uniref:methyltransferase family protein n=1 Tax=Paenarthrobacter sp. FR1 TaxID=3439548 RepID=UPI003DA3F645